MREDKPGGKHPSAEDMAAYVDGRVRASVRERIEAHAAECVACRSEIAEVTEVLSGTRRTPGWQVWAPVAAAAAVLVLVIAGPPGSETEPDGEARFRGPESTAVLHAADIGIASPRDASVPGPDGPEFVWHAAGPGASYRLTLTDVEGDVLWELGTTDTVLQLPDTIELEPGSVFYWYVDALLEDGRHATSGVHSFTTRH